MAHLPCVEHETATNPHFSIIWLHGLGADGHDFAPIVPELVAPSWPALRFVFPHAPMRPITINGGVSMRAWYDISDIDLAQREDAAGIRDSVARTRELIVREHARGIATDHVVLAGFSQGGAIALAAGLRQPERLAGIIALSTYLPLHAEAATEASAANHGIDIFQAHGEADPIVPPALGEYTHDWLRKAGYQVDWHTYAMGHQVCAEEISDLRAWLDARLSD